MNRIYKTIRRGLTGQTVVASEHAKGQGKTYNASLNICAAQVRSSSNSSLYSEKTVTSCFNRGSFFAIHRMRVIPSYLHLQGQTLALALFSVMTVSPAMAADDLYIYSGGGGMGGAGGPMFVYHGGGGGGGYMGTTDGGAGNGGDQGGYGGGGAGGGNVDSSLNGGNSTTTTSGTGNSSGPYAGGDGAVYDNNTSTGGIGGHGGSIIDPVITDTQFNSIKLGSGSGGNGSGTISPGGNSGNGGNGGDIAMTLNSNSTIFGNITMEAGNGAHGGQGIDASHTGSDGGRGGNINFGADSHLTVSGHILLTSGSNGDPGGSGRAIDGLGGTGGGVYFGYTDAGVTASSYTLIFADNGGTGHDVSLTHNGGEAKFNASGLTLEAGIAGAINTVNFTGVSDYDQFSLGDLTLNGHNALSFDADASSAIGDIAVSGMGNTITNSTNLTMQAGKILSFDLTGFSAANIGNTMLNIDGGNLTADAGGTIVTISNIPTLDSADFNWGDSATLADLSSGTFNVTAIGDDMTAASNYQLSYAVDMNSANTLQFLVNGLTADASYVGFVYTDMILENGAFYKNQGILNFSGNLLTVNSGHDFYAGVLNLTDAGNPTLEFSTATAWSDGSQTGTGFGDLLLGSINADGTAGAGSTPLVNGVLGSNYLWTGNLVVNGRNNSIAHVTNAAGVTDLSGKTITFNLPTNLTAGNILLTTNNADLSGASIAMTIMPPLERSYALNTLNNLNAGDQITLIAGIDQSTWDANQTEVTTSGGAIDYTFDLGTKQQGAIWNLTSTLQGEQFNDEKAHNALMSASAMHLLLAEGSDRVASVTNRFMPSVSPLNQENDIQRGVFMDMSGGHAKMKTGSHVKSNNFHLLAGPGIRLNQLNDAKTDLGFFLEAGWGNFDTYNSLYRGNGDTSYYGVGLLARHDMSSGLYGEASLRVGRAKSEYDSAYQTNFDIKSTYYGGHLGLGYILPVSEQGSLDLSAKLLYTHLEGGSDINESGDRMSVGNTDSTRSQLGIQYNHQLSNNVNVFARAVWDYEFDGKTNGSYSQYSISKTNSSGSTGIFSLGGSAKPSTNQNLSLDFKLNGYTGKREGIGANVMVNYSF